MSGWSSWFGGKNNANQRKDAIQAIVGLREQMTMLETREEHIQRQIDNETRIARANATTNKTLAMKALQRRKNHETTLKQISGQRTTLEAEVSTLESANINLETMRAMQRGASALQKIHGNLNIDKVDAVMEQIREQTDVANEVTEAISNPVGLGYNVDEDELAAELDAMAQEDLDNKLLTPQGVASLPDPVRSDLPSLRNRPSAIQEPDEDEEIRALQAEMSM